MEDQGEKPKTVRPRTSFSEIADHSPAYYDGRKSPRSLSRRKRPNAPTASGSIKSRSKVKQKGLSLHAVVICGSILCLSVAYVGNLWMQWQHPLQKGKNSALSPLSVPTVTSLPQFSGLHRERLFWGTYRPNLYLGIRSRSPQSLLAGLMWIAPHDQRYSLRHVCEHGDGLRRYGWLRHDGERFGRQELIDGGYAITTSFLKSGPRHDHSVEGSSADGYGGDWAVRVSVQSTDPGLGEGEYEDMLRSIYKSIPLIFYVVEESGREVQVQLAASRDGQTLLASGASEEYGPWELHVIGGQGARQHTYAAGFATKHMHNLTDLILRQLHMQAQSTQQLVLADTSPPHANMAAFQVTSPLPLELDFVFLSGVGSPALEPAISRMRALSGAALTSLLASAEAAYDARFEQVFSVASQGKDVDSQTVEVAKAALSNMVGGIGYFYGQSRIAIPPDVKSEYKERGIPLPPYWLYWPAPLYTAVPSRSFFPRGFLWDEGFHQLLVRRWDRHISLDVLAHWLDLVNEDGWIPREQILGDEARSKVPDEFVLQHTSNGNPPTLFLPIAQLAAEVAAGELSPDEDRVTRDFLRAAFPRLRAWFGWFNSTQRGELPGSFFWHGRDATTDRELNPKTLTSGLDDYPRASHPGPSERHLDLCCWMALAAGAMGTIADTLGLPGQEYRDAARELSDIDALDALHLDAKQGRYYDYGNHTESVRLQWVETGEVDPQTGARKRRYVRVAAKKPALRLVRQFGYVSLFPFLMKIIPKDSPALAGHLEDLRDESLLWTSFGLRSLAASSSLYMKRNTEHDPPYWRGPVWINVNYMALGALHHYASSDGPHRKRAIELYKELRANLVDNIVQQYRESGFLWEQYDNEKNGKGKGTHPFTGWTSLVVLMISEKF